MIKEADEKVTSPIFFIHKDTTNIQKVNIIIIRSMNRSMNCKTLQHRKREAIMKKHTRILLIFLTIILFGCSNEITSANSSDKGNPHVETSAENTGVSGKIHSEDDSSGESNSEDADSVAEGEGWVDTHISLNQSYDYTTVAGAYIYSCYQTEGEVHVICQNKSDGSVVREVTVPGITRITDIQANASGNIYLTGEKEDASAFLQIDSTGNINSFENAVLEDTENAMRAVDSKGMFTDANGLYYLWCELCIPSEEIYEEEEYARLVQEDPLLKDAYGYVERIYVKDEQMRTLFYVQVPSVRDSDLISFYLDEESIPTLFAKDTEGLYTQQIDVQQQKKSEKRYLDAEAEIPNDAAHITAADNGFLYCLKEYLYQFDYGTMEHTRLLLLSDYGIPAEHILYLGMREGKIEIISSDEIDTDATYTVLEKGQTQKQVLTLGVFMPTDDLTKIVSRYNREQSEVRIEFVTYQEEGMAFEDAQSRLNMDILIGNAPDLIDVSNLNYSVMAEKDIFVDLYTCMEQDRDLKAADLVPSVAQAYEIDGHLYAIAPAFQVSTMWGRSSVVQGHSGVSLAEFKQLLAEADEDLSAVGGFSVDEPLLVTLCTFGMDELINWDDKTCDFEGQYFRDILEFISEYNELKSARSGKSILNGGIVINAGSIYSVADYQIACEMFGEDVSFIGYPTESGSGSAVSFRGSQLAINAKEEHTEEAWKFLKYYMLNGYEMSGFPVLQDLFETCLAEAQEPIFETTMEGAEEMPHGSFYDGDNTILVYEADSHDVEQIRNLVENAANVFEYDTAILNIIQEEAQPYFAGQKSIEQVAEIIQNRIQLYLSE